MHRHLWSGPESNCFPPGIDITHFTACPGVPANTPPLHVASLSWQSPPTWSPFAVSFRTSTLALGGVADPPKAVRSIGALSELRCTSVWCG